VRITATALIDVTQFSNGRLMTFVKTRSRNGLISRMDKPNPPFSGGQMIISPSLKQFALNSKISGVRWRHNNITIPRHNRDLNEIRKIVNTHITINKILEYRATLRQMNTKAAQKNWRVLELIYHSIIHAQHFVTTLTMLTDGPSQEV
jgi:hypothetical protein